MDASTTELRAEITIDADRTYPGVLIIEQQYEIISSDIATKPDPQWEHIDSHGHFHAYDQDGKLPTLAGRARHIDCDGIHTGPYAPEAPCEGYDITEWFCTICDEQIKPGHVDDHGPRSIPTRKDWTIKVESDRPITGDKVTVRADMSHGMVMFGVAHVGGWEGTISSDHSQVFTTLYSASPLGTRSAAAVATR